MMRSRDGAPHDRLSARSGVSARRVPAAQRRAGRVVTTISADPSRGGGAESDWASKHASGFQLAVELGELPADKLVNRHVRPLLKALTRVTSAPANYFGRDWIAMAHRPIAFVGFAHSAEHGTGLLEAVIAVDTPLDPRPSSRSHRRGRWPAVDTAFRAVLDAIEASVRAWRRCAAVLGGGLR